MPTPRVKLWIVTTSDGAKYPVCAPSRLLARLSFRRDFGYRAIKSIGLSRKETQKKESK